jgi:hypothetical protein
VEIGFIGLGNMGTPIARRLLAAGHRLIVSDIDPEPVARLVGDGASAARTPAEVAARAETIIVSLPSPAALEQVALGGDGIAGGARVRRLIDLSTVGPDASRRVASGLAEHGVTLIDAPVSGGVGGATEGTLAVMVAAPAHELELVAPILSQLGRVVAVGDQPGMGQVMKLANNYLSGTALAATGEALVYGVKAGLDPATMIEVLNAGSGRNTATIDKFPRAVLPGTFDYGFAIGLMCKDLRLFAADAERVGVPLPVGDAVGRVWQRSCDELGEEADFTAVVRPLEQAAGVEIRSGSGTGTGSDERRR